MPLKIKNLLLLLILASLSLVSASSTYAQDAGIGLRPANPDPRNERTKSIFIKELEPGDLEQDSIKVLNNSEEEKDVKLYAVDSVASSGGAFACAQALDESSSVGSWIKLSESSFKLQPGENKEVAFSIQAPSRVDVGEHNGCIVLEEQKDTTSQSGVNLNFRTAVRVAVLVPGEIKKELTAEDIRVQSRSNQIIVSPLARNTGNVSLDTKVEVKLGWLFSPKSSSLSSTYPALKGQLSEWNFEFKKPFWGGIYKASYDLYYDKNPTSNLGSAPAGELSKVEGLSKTFFVLPHPLALLLELLLIALIIFLVRRALRHHSGLRAAKNNWVVYTVQPGDQLQALASSHGVSWKKLADVNKLKAPYHLEAGSTIKLPSSAGSNSNSQDPTNDSSSNNPTPDATNNQPQV